MASAIAEELGVEAQSIKSAAGFPEDGLLFLGSGSYGDRPAENMARFILVMVFIVEQRWRYIIDKELEADGITTKQWLMTIVIANGFKYPPSPSRRWRTP